ncbi:P1 family peptidase [Parahaliea mediterranea]|uniref:P1 family peptidase n=1 Tax=Parahaliea mediterranea TaxID=651086 RepID=UPI000E2F20DC|nr:P1 family peptidase [Parahaliea mediterranea]
MLKRPFIRPQCGRALRTGVALAALALGAAGQAGAQPAAQQTLQPVVNQAGARVLEYDWPAFKVGTGQYEEGPTGVTVFHFAEKSQVAVDVRGGGPGTVNAAYMELGYDLPELDTVVFAGGSWYGLEATTAVATALKDDGIRDGNAFSQEPNIAMSVGSIIFDFGARRLNEIYPDKRLAQAAFRAAQSGRFPLGAHGAGRFAQSGGFFGCNAHSGQGGAYRQFGAIKIAAFTVVNAYGVVTDRDGNVVACYPEEDSAGPLKTRDLMAKLMSKRSGEPAEAAKNTTISLLVTNQKMTPAELKRLAAQVHTSMARGLQPFATIFDGDVLYAVSTAEVEEPIYSPAELGTLASEVMWDAILSSVPEQPAHPQPADKQQLSQKALAALAGDYRFSPQAALAVRQDKGALFARASGERDVYAIKREAEVKLLPVAGRDFTVPGRYPLLLRFGDDGDLIVNPGHWQQKGKRE